MSLRSQIPFLFAVAIVAVGGTYLALQLFGGTFAAPETQTDLVTVVVYITNTPDPNATENVLIVTATPDRTQVPVPANLVPTGDGSNPDISSSPPVAVTLDSQANTVPEDSGSRIPQGCIVHVVDSGDTVFDLSVAYGVNFFLLLQVNNMTEETAFLQIGDELIIPVEGCPLDEITLPPTATPFPTDTPEGTEEAEATAESTEDVTPTPSVSPTITLAPTAENAVLEIAGVIEEGDVTAEGIRIRNPGSQSTVTVTDWTLEDLDGNVYTFRNAQRIFSNSEVTIYTRAGQDTPITLFWGLDEAVWEPGDVITLKDGNGDVQAIYRIPTDSDLP